MNSKALPSSKLKRGASFFGWSFIAAIAGAIVAASHLGALGGQSLVRVIAMVFYLTAITWPASMIGALVAFVFRAFHEQRLWPLLAITTATVLAFTSGWTLRILFSYSDAEQQSLPVFAVVCGFFLQTLRRDNGRPPESSVQSQLKSRVIICLLTLTVVLAVAAWTTNLIFQSNGPDTISDVQDYLDRKRQLAKIISLEIVVFLFSCVVVIYGFPFIRMSTVSK